MQLGYSAQQLADKTGPLGYSISRNTIASIESGRKELLSVQELATLARALEIAPIALLYPLDTKATVRVPAEPPVEVPAVLAARWFTGEHAYSPDTTDDFINRYGGGEYDDSAGIYEWYNTPFNFTGVLKEIRAMNRLTAIGFDYCQLIPKLQDRLKQAETKPARDALRAELGVIFSQLDGVLRAADKVDDELRDLSGPSRDLVELKDLHSRLYAQQTELSALSLEDGDSVG
jgi:transcriptional regulator with XRE-family HTH domain